MTEDTKIAFDDFEIENTRSEMLEKVEATYDELRETGEQDFDIQNDFAFDISLDDFSGM